MKLRKIIIAVAAVLVVAVAAGGIMTYNVLQNPPEKPVTDTDKGEAGKYMLGLNSDGTVAVSQGEQVVYVSVANGNDSNDGSFQNPVKTVDKGRVLARNYLDSMAGNVYIVMRGGEYNETLTVSTGDSGKNGFKTVFCSYPGEEAQISAGRTVTGFAQVSGKPYYSVQLAGLDYVRQLYVNGVYAEMSKNTSRLLPVEWYNDTNDATFDKDGYIIESKYLDGITFNDGMELQFQNDWMGHHFPVKEFLSLGGGRTAIVCKQPAIGYGAMLIANNNTGPTLEQPFYIMNSPSFLKEGQFAFDNTAKTLYYYPAPGIDMGTAVFEVPEREAVLTVKGYDLGSTIHDILFSGLTFKLGAWNRPSTYGYVGWQADWIMDGIPDQENFHYVQAAGNIELEYASNIKFEGNTFENMGAISLRAGKGVSYLDVIGNIFRESAGGAIAIGNQVQYWTETDDDPANPLCKAINFKNNMVYNVCQQYYSMAPFMTYYTDTCVVSHNDFINAPWVMLSMGWGTWNRQKPSGKNQNNVVEFNRIMYYSEEAIDTGGIYTLDLHNNSVERYNYLKDSGFATAAIYHDEGSRGWEDYKNVVDVRSVNPWANMWVDYITDINIHDNFSTTERRINRGTNTIIANTTYVPDRNWKPEPRDIMLDSGLEESYRYLRLKALGLPGEKLLFSYSPENRIEADEMNNVSKLFDMSGNGYHAVQGSCSNKPKWQGYAINNDHTVYFDKGTCMNIGNSVTADTFSAVFSLMPAYDMTPAEILEAMGFVSNGGSAQTTIQSLKAGRFGTYIYVYSSGQATLTLNGESVMTFASGGHSLPEDAVINKDGKYCFSMGEYSVFTSALTQYEQRGANEKYGNQYMTAPSQRDLQIWVSADKGVTADGNGYVAEWNSRSAKTWCGGFIQPDGSNRPKLVQNAINGKPAVRFDGTDDFLDALGLRWLSDEMSVIYVYKPVSGAGHRIGTANSTDLFGMTISSNGTLTGSQSPSDGVSTSAGAVQFGQAQIFGYKRHWISEGYVETTPTWETPMPGISELFLNGKLVQSGKTMVTEKFDRWRGIRLGGANSPTLNGDLAELLVYSRNINEQEMNGISEYLKEKYGIQ